jgi:hypothetical protein
MPAEPRWTGDTFDYVFQQPTGDSVQTILVLGDIHNRLQREDYDTLAARVPHIDAVAQVGDWLDRGQNYYYQMLVREWTNSALDSTPVIVCPGNHEYSKGVERTLSPVWDHAFPHPDNGPKNVPGASYFLDLPTIRFIVMDTNPLVHVVYLTRTLTWLRETMNSAGDRFIVVMMHHPVVAPGKGRANPLIYGAFRYALGQTDLVLAGHDHSYMRYRHFVVLNTAGKHKPQHLRITPDVTDSVPVYGIIQCNGLTTQWSDSAVVLQRSGLKFTVHRLSDGTQIDSLYVTHH